MAQAYPDGTLIGIIIMAILILAFLWRDRINGGGNGGNGGDTGTTTTDVGPSIHGHHRGDDELGGSFRVEGSYSTGSADDFDIEANLNGSTVQVEASNGNFRTQEVNVGEQNEYRVEITTPVGSDYDEGSFPGQEETPTPPEEEPPRVSVTRERVNDEEGAFDLLAEAEPGSAEIQATGFIKMLHVESGRGFDQEDRPEESRYLEPGQTFEYTDSNKHPGTYYYTAWTVDAEGRTDTYSDSFTIEAPGERIGGGTGGAGGQPLMIYNPQVLEERAGDLPPEFIQAVEALAESISESSGDQEVTVELGEELEGLVAAIENIGGNDVDISQVVAELRNIRQEIEAGAVDLSGLESQIEELIQTVEEQGGMSDEERRFYERILEKLDDIESEMGSSSELEDLEDLVEITIEPEQSVEVQGLSAEERMLFRRILMEMRGRGMNQSEFRWFVNQFVSMRANQQSIFQILQVIWKELEEEDDPDSYEGDNWELFLKTLRESEIDSSQKKVIIEVLEGNPDKYPFSLLWPVRFWRAVDSMDSGKVTEAAQQVVNYTLQSNAGINNEYFENVYEILEGRYALDRRSFTESRGHNPSDGELPKTFDRATSYMKNMLSHAKRIVELDEHAIEDFEQAMKVFQRESQLIKAFADIDPGRLERAVKSDEGHNEAVEIIKEAEEKAGVYDLRKSPEVIREIKGDLSDIENNLDEAHDLLVRIDDLLEEENELEMNLEEVMDAFEGTFIDQLESAVDVMEELSYEPAK
jgi:hypothetical protein